jgi:hypothetical protein
MALHQQFERLVAPPRVGSQLLLGHPARFVRPHYSALSTYDGTALACAAM